LIEQVAQRIHLVLRSGELSDQHLNARLKRGIPVPSERVITSYGQKAFYDARPAAEYVMEKIWMDFVVPGAAGQPKAEGKRHVEVPLSIQEVTRELQRAYGAGPGGHRDVEYPKVAWIRDALDRLAGLRLARRVDASNYMALYRHIRGDLLERFASFEQGSPRPRRPRGRSRGTDTRTLPLF
jgi:hypothetical protein